MRFFVVFLLLLLIGLTGPTRWQPAYAADAAANKALFERTVDKLNFQTMEGVYDARFSRQKFPVSLRTRAERREFKDFNGDAAFGKLFLNYNDEAEKYKARFGSGPATLAAFEKGLRGILVDANFEFFLAKAARRDDRAALIRKLEGTIKQAITQYDASGEAVSEAPQPDTLAGATGSADAVEDAPAATAEVEGLNETAPATADSPAPAAGTSAPAARSWRDTLALLLALSAAAGVAYLLFVVVPALRAQTQHVANTALAAPAPPALPDDHLPPTLAEEAHRRGVELRFELIADEVDELKARVRELELRLADALAAVPEAEAFGGGGGALEPVAAYAPAAPYVSATYASTSHTPASSSADDDAPAEAPAHTVREAS